jgi:hypothetical protein
MKKQSLYAEDLKKTEGRLASKSARQARLRNPQVDRAGALPPAAWTGREEQVVAAARCAPS